MHRLFSLFPIAALVAFVGCGSDSGAPEVVSGQYVATTQGDILSIDFIDSEDYTLVTTTCPGGQKSCSQAGTYALASDDKSIALLGMGSATPTTLTFSATSLAVPSADAGGISAPVSAILISTFMMGGQSFSNSASATSGTGTGSGSGSGTGSGSGSGSGSGRGSVDGGVGRDGGITTGRDGSSGTPSGDAGPQNIPVSIITASGNEPKVTVPITIGSTAITAILDTGTVGLFVAPGVVPDSQWTVSTTAASVTYDASLVVSGVIAQANVKVGGVSSGQAIPVVKVTGATCASGVSSCADTGSPFRFANNIEAVLGVGMNGTATLQSPLAWLGANHQYALRLSATGTTGTLQIDPPADDFDTGWTVTLPTQTASSTAPGVPGWDDTQVPFCMNMYCSTGLFDTGVGEMNLRGLQSGDYDNIGVPEGATTVPFMTVIAVYVDMMTQWMFTVARTPKPGVDLINLSSSPGTDDLGFAVYLQFDVLYDYANGLINLQTK